jgi:hypothetical protein
MSEAFIAEVEMFSSNFSPRDWAFCDGLIIEMEFLDCIPKREFGNEKKNEISVKIMKTS